MKKTIFVDKTANTHLLIALPLHRTSSLLNHCKYTTVYLFLHKHSSGQMKLTHLNAQQLRTANTLSSIVEKNH